MLSLHDRITKGKLLALTTEISTLAKVFFIEYNKLGGTQSWSAIETDFFIVACAALNDLNLIVSDDCRTLKSDKALEAYKNISVEKSIWIPHIWTYSDLKKKYNF